MPPPPTHVQPTMGFLYDLSHAEMRDALEVTLLEDESLQKRVREGTVRARIGRGGRVCLDDLDTHMWDPFASGPSPGGGGEAGSSSRDGDATNGVNGEHDAADCTRAAALERFAVCLLKV